jgi:hypothetical protein
MAKGTTVGEKSKKDIVKELLARGVTGPREISEAAKVEFQADITPGHASNIKSTLGKKAKKKAVVRGNRVVPAKASSNERQSNGERSYASDAVTLENLALRFALKAGGIDRAIAAIEKLR